MPGIEQLKKGIDFVAVIAPSIEEKLQDKKINLMEAVDLIWDARPAIDLFKARQEFWQEAVEVDYEERDQLVEYFIDKFDLDDDEAEDLVEDYISWLDVTFDLYKKTLEVVKKDKPEVPPEV